MSERKGGREKYTHPPFTSFPDRHRQLPPYASPLHLCSSTLLPFASRVHPPEIRPRERTLPYFEDSTYHGGSKDKDQPNRTFNILAGYLAYQHSLKVIELRATENIIKEKVHLLSAIEPPAWDTAISRLFLKAHSKNSQDDRTTLDGHGQ